MNTYYQSESLEHFQLVLEKAFGLSLKDTTSRSLYALCRGYLPLARTLSKSTIDKENLTGDIIEIWQAQLPNALLKCFDTPSELTLQVIQTLLKLGPLPISALESTPTMGPEIREVLALDTWFNNNRGVISLRSETLSRLVLDFIPVTSSQIIIEHLISIFENRITCCDKVITAALFIGDIELAEQLLERFSTHLLSQLKLHSLQQLTDQLDCFRPIQDPKLLFNCACCHFLLGNIETSRDYFRRVLKKLKDVTGRAKVQQMSETDRAAFFAGVVLYSKFTAIPIDDHQLLSEQAQTQVSISSTSTFLKVYRFSRAGQLDKLNKLVNAGLLRCESLGEYSLYVLFTMINFWNLLLSCNYKEAMDLLEKSKLYLLENGIVYTGAHEWLQLMDLLRLRLEGRLSEVEHLARVYLDTATFSADPIRKLFIKVLVTEINIIRQQTPLVDETFQELIQLHNQSFHLTYWLPTASELRRIHESIVAKKCEPAPTLTEAEEQIASGVKTQATLLFSLKIQFDKQESIHLYPIIKKFILALTESSQWLRRYEVLVLKAVYLFHYGNNDQAIVLFSDVVLKLSQQNLLGVLLDPFLHWRVFLEQPCHFPGRSDLVTLLDKNGLSDKLQPTRESIQAKGLLSKREKQVITLLAKGLKNKEIAESLNVSLSTIRTHLQNIYSKFSVDTRAAAIVYAYQHGVIQHDHA